MVLTLSAVVATADLDRSYKAGPTDQCELQSERQTFSQRLDERTGFGMKCIGPLLAVFVETTAGAIDYKLRLCDTCYILLRYRPLPRVRVRCA